MTGPLSAVRVVDWTMMGVGPFTGAVLGALGADVIKIEPPEGDFMATNKPLSNGFGGAYLACNTSKRSMRVDVRSERGANAVRRLIERSDVLVTNLRFGALDKLGFGYEAARALNPDLIYLQATGFGEMGPMAYATGGDHWNQVFSGWCSIMGAEGGDPELLRCLGHIDFNTSLYNVAAVLTALYARGRKGGALINTSMLEASLALQCTRLAEYLMLGIVPGPLGSAAAAVAPSQAFRAEDDWLYVSADTQSQWERLCVVLGAPQLVGRLEYSSNAARVEHRKELAGELQPLFARFPVAWWLRNLGRAKVPAARFWDFEAIITHPQVTANEHVVPLERSDDAVTGGVPWKFTNTPARVGPPTFSGEDTEALLTWLEAPQVLRQRPAHDGDEGPDLAGMRFLDLTNGISGPYCGAMLADAGAEVIKLESPEGDYLKSWVPAIDGVSVAYLQLNRRKEVRTLDQSELRALVATVDGVILDAIDTDGNPPPISADEIRSLNPEAIVVTTSPYGELGPLAGVPGSELTVQAMSEALNGLGRIGDPPARIGADQASLVGGLVAYHAMLGGLWQRQQTGRGETVSTSALGGLLTLRSYFLGSMSVAREWSGLWLSYTDAPSKGTRTADRPVLWTLNTRLSKAADPEGVIALLKALDTEPPPGMDPAAERGTPADPGNPQWNGFWEEVFRRHGWTELAQIFGKHGGQVVPLLDYPGLDAHPQVAVMKPFRDEVVAGRKVRTVPLPWRVYRTSEVKC